MVGSVGVLSDDLDDNSFKLEADDMPIRSDIKTVLEVNSHGHASVAFVHNKFVGN